MSTSTTCRTRTPHRTRSRYLLAGVALAIALAGCSNAADEPGSASGQADQQVAPIAKAELLKLPEATTFGDIAEAPRDPDPASVTTGTVLKVREELPVYDARDGKAIARMPAKQLGSPTWLPVIDKQGDWYQVLLPSRPNGSTGWLHGTKDTVDTATNDFHVKVDLAEFRLAVLKDGQEQGDWKIGIGKPEFPTPTGRTSIISSLEETVKNYSPIILPLGTHSESHDTFGGGPGTVAMHGWPDDSVLGTKTSDGCIRVPDDALDKLSTLPLGTVVIIS